jgi:hypothetical protein
MRIIMGRPTPEVPRRTVRYQVHQDPLGSYITFALDVPILPDDIPPYKLPADTRLEWARLQCRFSGSPRLGAHDLRRLFLEFADVMNWDAYLDVGS